MLPFVDFLEEHTFMVSVVVVVHVAVIGALLICLATQDTDPAWLKEQQGKKA